MNRLRLILLTIASLAALGIAAAQTTSTSIPSVDKTVGQTATITWTAPTDYTNGTAIASGAAITYNVYAAPVQAAGSTCSASSFGAVTVLGLTSAQYVTDAYAKAGVYCYYVTAVVADMESAPSTMAEAIVSNPIPNAPTAISIQ